MGMVGEQVEAIRNRQWWMELYVNRYHNTYQAINQIVNDPELNAIHTRLSKGLSNRKYAQPYLNRDVDFNMRVECNHLHILTAIKHGDPDSPWYELDTDTDTDTDDDDY